MNYEEKKIAPVIAERLSSGSPEDMKKLGQLLSTNSDAYTLYQKMAAASDGILLNSAIARGQTQEENVPEFRMKRISTGQASGGRIERKSGGRAASNPISAEVSRVRVLLSNKTEHMLSVPDDAIATALHMAKNR